MDDEKRTNDEWERLVQAWQSSRPPNFCHHRSQNLFANNTTGKLKYKAKNNDDEHDNDDYDNDPRFTNMTECHSHRRRGTGVELFELTSYQHTIMTELHDLITQHVPIGVTWGEDDHDDDDTVDVHDHDHDEYVNDNDNHKKNNIVKSNSTTKLTSQRQKRRNETMKQQQNGNEMFEKSNRRITNEEISTRTKQTLQEDTSVHTSTKDKDPRRRRYAFLPNQRQALINSGIKIQPPSSPPDSSNDKISPDNKSNKGTKRKRDEGKQEHDSTMAKSSIDIEWYDVGNGPTSTNDDDGRQQDDSDEWTTSTVTGKNNYNTEKKEKQLQLQSLSRRRRRKRGQETRPGLQYPIISKLRLAREKYYPVLKEVTDLVRQRLSLLSKSNNNNLPSKSYTQYVSMDQLIAIQPNHHNGATFLPLHLDFPRNDGFGIVIVTIAIRNNNDSNSNNRTGSTISKQKYDDEIVKDHEKSTTTPATNLQCDMGNSTTTTTTKISSSKEKRVTTTVPSVLNGHMKKNYQSHVVLVDDGDEGETNKNDDDDDEKDATDQNDNHHDIGRIVVDDDDDDNQQVVDTGETKKIKQQQQYDEEESMSWSFPLCDGQGYILSGDARNKCVHGVLVVVEGTAATRRSKTSSSSTCCPSSSTTTTTLNNPPLLLQHQQEEEPPPPFLEWFCQRETLNLRYGLHTPELAHNEIDRHWSD